MFWLYLALSIFAYMNIGYLMMWLSARVVLKRARKVTEFDYAVNDVDMDIIWWTYFLFPLTTISWISKFKDLRILWTGKTVRLSSGEHPIAFIMLKDDKLDKMMYRYGTPFIWPLKIAWLAIVTVFFFAIMFVLYPGRMMWNILTLPIRRFLKPLED